MKPQHFFAFLLICAVCILCVRTQSEQSRTSNRISRLRGNILRNLTRTHEYENNIVTSQLDASVGVRQLYRTIREIYNRYTQAESIKVQWTGITINTTAIVDYWAVPESVTTVLFYRSVFQMMHHFRVMSVAIAARQFPEVFMNCAPVNGMWCFESKIIDILVHLHIWRHGLGTHII